MIRPKINEIHLRFLIEIQGRFIILEKINPKQAGGFSKSGKAGGADSTPLCNFHV